MTLKDADELIKQIQTTYCRDCKDCTKDKDFFHCNIEQIIGIIQYAHTIDLWHYPSRGELPDKDWTKHHLNVSKECFVLTKRGIGTIARWDNDYKMWFENQPNAPITEVIAWQYFEPPKEEA